MTKLFIYHPEQYKIKVNVKKSNTKFYEKKVNKGTEDEKKEKSPYFHGTIVMVPKNECFWVNDPERTVKANSIPEAARSICGRYIELEEYGFVYEGKSRDEVVLKIKSFISYLPKVLSKKYSNINI